MVGNQLSCARIEGRMPCILKRRMMYLPINQNGADPHVSSLLLHHCCTGEKCAFLKPVLRLGEALDANCLKALWSACCSWLFAHEMFRTIGGMWLAITIKRWWSHIYTVIYLWLKNITIIPNEYTNNNRSETRICSRRFFKSSSSWGFMINNDWTFENHQHL